MLRSSILPILLCTLAAPAVAQGPAAPPFSGPRIEVLAGTDGAPTYGGAIGYDFRTRGIVIGVEGELLESTHRNCDAATLSGGVAGRICALTGRDLYGGIRVGAPIARGTLLYVKGGYTNIRAIFGVDTGPGTPTFRFGIPETLDGVRVGGGIEQRIGGRAYIKGEYRYSDYGAGSYKHDAVIGLGIRF